MIETIFYMLGALVALIIAALPGILFILFLIFLWYNFFGGRNKKSSKQKSSNTWKPNNEKVQWDSPNQTEQQYTEPIKPKPNDDEISYESSYQARQLFTRNEWQNYQKLRDVARVKNYEVCPKVRLLDIIEPRRGEKKYKTLFYKIQSKHVDFVICDQNMNIKAIIELDDNSHNRKDRQDRDQFVDLILKSVGYKVIHTRYINYDILDLV